jgi:hypothetical protein
MDKYLQVGDWIVGKVDDGYIAVATPGGFSPLKSGDTAYQEWIPNGNGALYLTVLGNKSDHGSLKKFINTLGAPQFNEKQLEIDWKSDHHYHLGWNGPFHIDGKSPQIVNGLPELPPRLKNNAVTLSAEESILDAQFEGESLKLDVIKGLRLNPKSQV